ncbi:MAG: hypothetical protein AAF702_26875 [Chloroflexota bacterium]
MMASPAQIPTQIPGQIPGQPPNQPPNQPPPVKGSWEDLLGQAIQLDQNRNVEAIPIYEKLISRIHKLPEAKRMAHGKRLQRIGEEVAVRAYQMYASLEQYEKSLEMLDILGDILDEEDLVVGALQGKINVMIMANRYDDALALNNSAPQPPNVGRFHQLIREFYIYIEAERLDQARDVLKRYQAKLGSSGAEAALLSAVSEGEPNQERATLARMKSVLSIEEERWDEAIAFHVEAGKLSDEENDYHNLYSTLIHRGQMERSLPLIENESSSIRQRFWRGLAYSYMGKKEEAAISWQSAIGDEEIQEESGVHLEWVLSHYYLGDKERIGLEAFLRMLREVENPSWQLFFFTALGWAMHKNSRNALHNMDFAVDRIRRDIQSSTLPWTMWRYIEDLVPQEDQAQYLPYLDEAKIASRRI